MRPREKILLAILVFCLVAWQAGRLVNHLWVDPIRRSQARLERLDAQIDEQKRETAELLRVTTTLQDRQQRSLPPDPLTAQRLYLQWLTDLAQDCGFAEPKVFPDRVTRKNDACVGVLVSIDAEATLDQLCLFLSRFNRTDLAQQITVLNIDSTQDQGDPILRVAIMAEGLSLRDAPDRRRLFPISTLAHDLGKDEVAVQFTDAEGGAASAGFLARVGGEYLRGVSVTENTWTVQRGADGSLRIPHRRGALVEFIPVIEASTPTDYTQLVARNPFAKPVPIAAAPPAPEKDETPEIDPAEFAFLVAAFSQDNRRQAWFYDRWNNETFVIGLGEPFSVAGIKGVVQTIGDDFVLLDHDESRWRLKLGKNLRSMERLPDSASGANTPR